VRESRETRAAHRAAIEFSHIGEFVPQRGIEGQGPTGYRAANTGCFNGVA